jgi:UDP-4-amino-4,6-dideoxy-N-acetyl-beta-L-altrosamine transaminase
MSHFMPYGRHAIDEDDMKAVEMVLEGDWLTGGSNVDNFEQKLCQLTHSPFAVSCSNGTTALHLAMLALDIGPGDVVVVPAITFLASANAARFVGADAIFADVDPDTGLMTAATLEQAITNYPDPSKIKAVINVHLNGQCEDLEAIYAVAQKYRLFVVEDAAHAIGTHYVDSQGQKHAIGANRYSDLTTFSFHPLKTIATGEGGAVTCQSEKVAQRLKLSRCHGMDRTKENWQNKEQGFDEAGTPNPWYYEMHDLGYNYRISDINCALGLNQLTKLDQFKEQRKRMVEKYDAALKNIPYLSFIKKNPSSDTAWHLYVVKIDFKALGKSRAQVMNTLRDQNIGTQVHYMPLYRHPYYEKLYGPNSLPGAEAYFASCLSIPLYIGLTDEQQEVIVGALRGL